MSTARAPQWPTVVLASALVVLVVADLTTLAQHLVRDAPVVAPWLEASTAAITYGTVGWFISSRIPGHRLGPVMLVLSAAASAQLFFGTLAILSVDEGWNDAAQAGLGGAYSAMLAVVIGSLVVVVLLAPTGRPLSRFYERVCWTVVGATIVSWALFLLLGVDDESLPGGPADQSLVSDAWVSRLWPVVMVATLTVVGASLLAIVSLALRYRRTWGEERRQVTWVVGGGLAGLLLLWTYSLLSERWAALSAVDSLVWAIGPSLLPLGIAVAVLRHGLYELDSIVSRTVSYAVVTGAVVAIYALIITGVTQLVPVSDSVAVVAATLVAAGSARPLLRRVRGRVDRHFNRERFDYVQAVAGYSAQMQSTVDPELVRAYLSDVLHRTLQPRQLSIWVKGRA